MNKTIILTPKQIKSIKVLLDGFDDLCERVADSYYDRYIFEPDYPGQRPVEKYMKNSDAYKAFKDLTEELTEDLTGELDDFENAVECAEPLSREQVAEEFKKSPLHFQMIQHFGRERYEGIFENIVNAVIRQSANKARIREAVSLSSLLVWEQTEQGWDYWREISLNMAK